VLETLWEPVAKHGQRRKARRLDETYVGVCGARFAAVLVQPAVGVTYNDPLGFDDFILNECF
jgi:hypothetical protein